MRSDKKRNSILVVCIVLSITCIGIKLFSSQFYYSYEPVTGIMLRSLPSLDNYKKNPQPNDGYIILCDENSFQGEIVYRTVVEWLWFFLPLVTIALVFKR